MSTEDTAVLDRPTDLVSSSTEIPERTSEQKQQGLKEAAERAKDTTIHLPADVAKPKGESKLPNTEQPEDLDKAPKEIKPAEKQQEKPPEAPKTDEKNPYGVPAKFLNDDGTPDFKRLSDAFTNAEKLLGKKNYSNVSKAEELTYTPNKEAAPVDPANLKSFQEKAFKAGMTKEQFAVVMSEYEALTHNTTTANKLYTLPNSSKPADVANIKKTLEQVWGPGEDAWTEGTNKALKAVEAYLPSAFKITDPVFSHPAVIGLLASIGNELGEGTVTGKDKAGSAAAGLRTPQEIRALPDYKGNEQKYDAEIMKWYSAQPGGKKLVGGSR